MRAVVPTIKRGGVSTVYVMPNLTPPITTVKQANEYRRELRELDSSVNYMMTLYMHPSITPITVIEAKEAGISGIKIYPAGVTTNSDAGVLDLEPFYPVIREMQEVDMVLNLHGEVGCTCDSGPEYVQQSTTHPDKPGAVTVLNAEHAFLPTLRKLHNDFPRLRIVLEHASTKAALEAVRDCGPTVAGTITAHHLFLTVDDVVGDGFAFCKPTAKTPSDRVALQREVVDPSSKFFFGSDSAPHLSNAKYSSPHKKAAAGCFTQAYATQLVISALEDGVCKGWFEAVAVNENILREFLGARGNRFYKVGTSASRLDERILLEAGGETIETSIRHSESNAEIVNFRCGKNIWSLKWTE
ncbi:MAG: hypothetical protein Q9162_003975 [Coniocarpon cinnabarinum]